MAFFYHSNLQEQEEIELSAEESQHMTKVLRSRIGDKIRLIDGQGKRAEAEVLSIPQRRGAVVCRVDKVEEVARPPYRIHLYLAPPRNKILPSIIRQVTELGVSDVHLIDADFSVSKKKNEEASMKDVLNACKQSGNPYFTKLHSTVSFKEALAACDLPNYFGAVPSDPQIDSRKHEFPTELAIWVGPEGGFSEAEKQNLIDSGAQGISLGSWILRVETAVTALIARVV